MLCEIIDVVSDTSIESDPSEDGDVTTESEHFMGIRLAAMTGPTEEQSSDSVEYFYTIPLVPSVLPP